MRRLLSIGVVLAALAAAVALGGASAPGSDKPTFKIYFDNAFGLTEGGDLRVGGVTAGTTSDFTVDKRKGRSPKAVVTAKVTKPGFGDFRKDASCEVKPQSLISEYFVDCQPGTSEEKLATDGTGKIGVKRTASTVPPDLINNILRRPYKERFRLIITELGTGLAGRPKDLQEVVKRAHPGLRETSKTLKILGNQNRIIERFIVDSDRVVGQLENNKRDVVRFVKEAGDAAEISATRREALQESFRKLPTFLGELEPTMARLGELTDEQMPLLADLKRVGGSDGDLNTFLTRLGPFAEASRPALRSLGKASEKGTEAIRQGKQEIDVLAQFAPQAKPTFKPVRQFLQTMDDRRRAIENDPRAKNGSPPLPDPTAVRGQGGFTGLEAIWNYAFWQALSLNGYDDTGHVLRTSVTATACSQLDNDEDPNSAKFKECSQWLGPDLPGLNKPDFTTSSSARARPASRPGEERSAGEPDATALPGQRDISKPQVTLPPGLQQLLDELPRGQRQRAQERLDSSAPQGAAPSDTQLLDFLLAP